MRALVIGATGYIGSRLVAVMLAHGHEVVAGARDPGDLDAFWWSDRVERVRLDVLDAASVSAAVLPGLDAVVYLVHGMGGDDFADTDPRAAAYVREAVDAATIGRVVYLSGIIPPVPEDRLSEHLRSRLAVERTLSAASSVVITLRAAMIIGSGSTSFELMTQLSGRLPVTVIPDWMRHDVEPVAVVDVVAAIAGALDVTGGTRSFDIGGGERLPYPELIDRVATARGEARPQLTIPLLPEALVAKVASWIADVPAPTVTALMASLQEDMVSGDDDWRRALVAPGSVPLTLQTAIDRAIAPVDPLTPPSERDPMGPLPGDPDWAEAAHAG